MNFSLIIPARYESSRLPGKPLIMIDGKPMLLRTWEQCVQACEPDVVYVATDDERVQALCQEHGMQVVMTSPHCLTGTDRVAECARTLDSDVFVNVQGDEPVFNPDDVRDLVAAAERFPGEVINGYCDLVDEYEYRSTQVPKVVLNEHGRLLYMSRGNIPASKSGEFVKGWRQVCAYAFPREALERFSECEAKTPLESMEDIEILRFLELGFEVRMIRMSESSIPVDYSEDIAKVEKRLRAGR